jgi:hypothetical protein
MHALLADGPATTAIADTASLPPVVSVPVVSSALCRDLGSPLAGQQLQAAIQQLDEEGTGSVSFGRFLLWWKQ